MASHTYLTNGYSNYPDVLPEESGYVYGPNQHVNWYTVETTTVERFHAPPNGYDNFDGGYNNFDNGYNRFGGVPLKNDYQKEYMPKYAPRGHHEIYEHNYGSDYVNASSPRFHERENLMDNFLNKLQIGANRPMKTGNLLGPNKYRPTSPNKYRPKSPTYGYPSGEPHFIQAQYLPAPNRYRPTSPNKYRPTSPTKYRPISPTKYRPTSPIKYRPISPTKYRPASPTKYRPISPNKYRHQSPTKYRPSGQPHNQTTSRGNYAPTSPINYRQTSPTKYRPISPAKYQPTNMTKFQHVNPSNYEPTSPTDIYPSKENHMFTAQNLPNPNNDQHSNPVHNVPSREIKPIKTQSISDPNKSIPSNPTPDNDRNVKADDISGPNNHWRASSPPTSHKPLTTPTGDINEALSSGAEETTNSPRPQPGKSENRFGWNALGAKTRRFMKSDTIDNRDA